MDFNEVIPDLMKQIKDLEARVKALENASQPVHATSKSDSKK